MTNSEIYFVITLSAIGIINTIYLIYHSVKKTPVKCIFFPSEWCEKVQASKYSRTFGIKNSVAGLGMYSGLLILSILLYTAVLNVVWPIQALVWIGFLFSTYFLFIQGFVLKAFCTWCVLSAIEFSLLFLVIIIF